MELQEYVNEWKRQICDVIRVNNSCVDCSNHVVHSRRLECVMRNEPITHTDGIWCSKYIITTKQYVDNWINSNLGCNSPGIFYDVVPIEDIPTIAEIVEIIGYRFSFNKDHTIRVYELYKKSATLTLMDIGKIFVYTPYTSGMTFNDYTSLILSTKS